MEFMNYLFIIRLLGFISGVLLFYFALRLLNTLKNKEIAISMVFLHKKRIIKLFGLLIIASSLAFIAGILFVMDVSPIIVESVLDLFALTLLVFTVLLQNLMKGEK